MALPEEVTAIMAILRRYFQHLEDGTVADLMPDPTYQWCFYKGEMTIERMRRGMENLDAYLDMSGQLRHAEAHDAQGNYKETPDVFDAGPGYSRLPDAALVAMVQECDAVLARLQPDDEMTYDNPES